MAGRIVIILILFGYVAFGEGAAAPNILLIVVDDIGTDIKASEAI